MPPNGLVSPAGALPAGVRDLYRDTTGYGLFQTPDPDVLRWITDGAWSGHYGFLVFALWMSINFSFRKRSMAPK